MIIIDTSKLTNNDILQFILSNGMINLEDVQENMRQKEKERILSKHKYSIFQANDGRWKTTVDDETKKSGRRYIAKKSYDDLIKNDI